MDKDELKKHAKKAFFNMFIGTAIISGILALVAFLGALMHGENVELEYKIIYILIPILVVVYVIGIPLFAFFIIKIIMNCINNEKKRVKIKEGYYRDIPKEVSPAIASLLYDLKIDEYKDYTATLMTLYSRGFLKIENNYLKIINIEDIVNLKSHELYILKFINSEIEFETNKFKELVFKDAQEEKFITTQKENIKIKKEPNIIVISICVFLIILILNSINVGLAIAASGILVILFYIIAFLKGMYSEEIVLLCSDIKYYRTEKGIQMSKKLESFKKFLKDYTLLNEKQVEDFILLDEYIPYGIVLGEAKEIEELISANEKYMDFIYKNEL